MGQVAGTTYSVDITTTPLGEGIGDIDALIEAVADHAYEQAGGLHLSVGGDLASRTIGVTATVEAATHLAAVETVLRVFGQACVVAGLGDDASLEQLLGPINVVPAAVAPAA